MNSNVVDVLLALHALSGCDTTRYERRNQLFKQQKNLERNILKSFAKSPITDDMVSSPEKFLIDCLSNDKKYKHSMSYITGDNTLFGAFSLVLSA